MTSAAPQHHDLVPLADRMRYMQTFRLGAGAVLLAAWLALPVLHALALPLLAGVTGAYLGLALVAEAAWRILRRRGLLLFGVMLILDAVYLAWLVYVTGGSASPLGGLILLHVIAVALLASFRTGMKIALWHSLLAVIVFYAKDAGVLPPQAGESLPLAGSAFRLLVMNVLVLWAVAIATATYAAVNERELRRRRYDLEALARLAFQLETTSEPVAIGGALIDVVVDDFGFTRAALIAVQGERLGLLACHGLDPLTHDADRPGPASALRRAETDGESVRVAWLDPDADPWLVSLLPNARNLLIVPLHAEGRVIGFLVVEHALRGGSRIERRVVTTVERFASHAALALTNAWLLEQVQQLAISDALTGLPNRRQFEAALGRELARSNRTGRPVSLLMLDIDHFKSINDTHGHQAGDDVLREVARRLADSARAEDIVARYGGEEFAIIVPEADGLDAAELAERLRAAVEALPGRVQLTASLGLATFPRHAADADSLIEAADRALYESKRAGRNQTTSAPEHGPVVL